MRLDVYLVTNHNFTSRATAQDAIKAGRISLRGNLLMKASYQVLDDDQIEVEELEHQFASRAGIKLYESLHNFHINLKDRVVLDVGASTGGFSDVCLKAGAKHVYAVDVGVDQLITRLRNDDRVSNLEGVNCRYLEKDMFPFDIDFVCMDVSFISIKLLIDSIMNVCSKPYEFLFLIKPQFEVEKMYRNKHGIVKDRKIHKRVLEDFINFFHSKQLNIIHLEASHITGRGGNQEYLIHLKSDEKSKSFDLNKIVK